MRQLIFLLTVLLLNLNTVNASVERKDLKANGRNNAKVKVEQTISALPLFKLIKQINPLEKSPKTDSLNNKIDNRPIDPYAIAGFVCSVISGPLLVIFFCSIALKRIQKDPEKYRGKKLAWAGLIISFIWLIPFIYILVILATGGGDDFLKMGDIFGDY